MRVQSLRGIGVPAAVLLGAPCLLIAAVALRQLDETFGKDLDFIE